jgi:hypothetical protein
MLFRFALCFLGPRCFLDIIVYKVWVIWIEFDGFVDISCVIYGCCVNIYRSRYEMNVPRISTAPLDSARESLADSLCYSYMMIPAQRWVESRTRG